MGVPIIQHQAIAFMLADMVRAKLAVCVANARARRAAQAMGVETARLAYMRAAWELDQVSCARARRPPLIGVARIVRVARTRTTRRSANCGRARWPTSAPPTPCRSLAATGERWRSFVRVVDVLFFSLPTHRRSYNSEYPVEKLMRDAKIFVRRAAAARLLSSLSILCVLARCGATANLRRHVANSALDRLAPPARSLRSLSERASSSRVHRLSLSFRFALARENKR